MSTFTKGLAVLVVGCSVVLVGCGDKGSATTSTSTSTTTTPTLETGKPTGAVADSGLAGHYTLAMTMPDSKNPNDPASKMAAAMASSSSLDIKGDNTFAMTMMSIPMEGTWTSADKKVVLKPTKIMGKTLDEMRKADPKAKIDDKPLELQLGDDGKLTATDPSGKGNNMVFTKAPK